MEVVEDSSLGYGTIMRFCQKLGCSGLHKFKVLLAQEMALPKVGDNLIESDRISMYGKKIAAELVNTDKLIDRRVLLKVTEALNGARRVLAQVLPGQQGREGNRRENVRSDLQSESLIPIKIIFFKDNINA